MVYMSKCWGGWGGGGESKGTGCIYIYICRLKRVCKCCAPPPPPPPLLVVHNMLICPSSLYPYCPHTFRWDSAHYKPHYYTWIQTRGDQSTPTPTPATANSSQASKHAHPHLFPFIFITPPHTHTHTHIHSTCSLEWVLTSMVCINSFSMDRWSLWNTKPGLSTCVLHV